MIDPFLTIIGIIFFVLIVIWHESKDKDNSIIGIIIILLIFITLYYCYRNHILY